MFKSGRHHPPQLREYYNRLLYYTHSKMMTKMTNRIYRPSKKDMVS